MLLLVINIWNGVSPTARLLLLLNYQRKITPKESKAFKNQQKDTRHLEKDEIYKASAESRDVPWEVIPHCRESRWALQDENHGENRKEGVHGEEEVCAKAHMVGPVV